ncbi:MAG: prepilin-type N-terminal cleavage/methylation domain-containing protein [Fimbriimonadaceae bacterium]|nr:prepilin-type N-terminal cleavage/methylation domain-containing protein [Fimbriimonadaceae bacterium]QYK56873.1 MAG: prepilin-type N-terminal cleavage/methylation domain-containing protein [Fimbriimonadaceae bacterium]
MRRPSRSGAFTLIELLVVIAIISILAAIIFPVFANAKASAFQTTCMMNMRQVGIGLQLYRTDHSDFWAPGASTINVPGYPPQNPWIGYDNTGGALRGGWYGDMDRPATKSPAPGKIDPYLKNHQIKRCPLSPGNYQMVIAYNFFNNEASNSTLAYYRRNPAARLNEYGPGAKNARFVGPRYYVSEGVNDGEIDDPVKTLVAWEHGAWAPACVFLQVYDWDGPPPSSQSLIEHFNFLHREGAMTLWADSRARRMTYKELKRPYFSVRKDIYPDWP